MVASPNDKKCRLCYKHETILYNFTLPDHDASMLAMVGWAIMKKRRK